MGAADQRRTPFPTQASGTGAGASVIHRGVEILSRLARRHDVALRQSYTRVSTHARREVARLIQRGRHLEAERKVSRMRTWLGLLALGVIKTPIQATQFAAR